MIFLFKLLIGHAVADFSLQHHQIAIGKNRHNDPPGYDPKLHGTKQAAWFYYMTAHALVHAGVVWVATDRPLFAVAEFVLHWIIDFGKCERLYGIHIDQVLHFISKIVYALALIWNT